MEGQIMEGGNKLGTSEPIGTSEPVKQSHDLEDVYKELTSCILEKIDNCRGYNSDIRHRLSFVLNNNIPDSGCCGECEDKNPEDSLIIRLNTIMEKLDDLRNEQSSILDKTRY